MQKLQIALFISRISVGLIKVKGTLLHVVSFPESIPKHGKLMVNT